MNIHRWKFISSSLFFVYGELINHQKKNNSQHIYDHHHFYSQNLINHNDFNDSSSNMIGIIKMIDFAHVFPNNKGKQHQQQQQHRNLPTNNNESDDYGIDHNYLYGLDKLDHYIQMASAESRLNSKSTN